MDALLGPLQSRACDMMNCNLAQMSQKSVKYGRIKSQIWRNEIWECISKVKCLIQPNKRIKLLILWKTPP